MRTLNWAAALGAVALISSVSAFAADDAATADAPTSAPAAVQADATPKTAPADATASPDSTTEPAAVPEETTEKRPRARVPKEFAKLADLTDDEKKQIIAIQQKRDMDIAAITKKALADQTAVLTDDQRTQLEADLAKAKSARSKKRHKSDDDSGTTAAPATQPDAN